MTKLYINTSEVDDKVLNQLDNTLKSFDEAIDACRYLYVPYDIYLYTGGYIRGISSNLSDYKTRFAKVSKWVKSSNKLYKGYVDDETAEIGKCEVPHISDKVDHINASK